jgi:hypothetical protein
MEGIAARNRKIKRDAEGATMSETRDNPDPSVPPTLREAQEYMQHKRGCPCGDVHAARVHGLPCCTCGLSELLALIAAPATTPSDDQLREWWQAVQGTYAGLTGPLVRFAARVWEEAQQQTRWVRAQRDVAEARLAEREQAGTPPCGGCGGPHPFDTSIPSVLWNEVVRPSGGSDYLCATCILRLFAAAGRGFVAELYGEGFHGLPIEVTVNGEAAQAAAKIQDENNLLRHQLREANAQLTALTQERDRLLSVIGGGRNLTPITERAHALVEALAKLIDEPPFASADSNVVDRLVSAAFAALEARAERAEAERDEARAQLARLEEAQATGESSAKYCVCGHPKGLHGRFMINGYHRACAGHRKNDGAYGDPECDCVCLEWTPAISVAKGEERE